ncbi:hypothetical protein PGTUg99_025285 [Puccinia graminis f. sp. tritici]|uniref:Uncharacterized protein n=1 Tax=Puccinia graminis f. sp. tritici TaxID=56615 RepID=A0A5B0M7K9_PUCGR|nr:hypothetical protein PGTUg99_025285 [Puccinia graminis f. sp. tritici]
MQKLDVDRDTPDSKTPNRLTLKTSNALAPYLVIASWLIAFDDRSNTPAKHERSFEKEQKPCKFYLARGGSRSCQPTPIRRFEQVACGPYGHGFNGAEYLFRPSEPPQDIVPGNHYECHRFRFSLTDTKSDRNLNAVLGF